MLTAISPIDGRYASQTRVLSDFFSEYALIRYRVLIEVEYFKALVKIPLPALKGMEDTVFDELTRLVNAFTLEDAERIKAIEKETNHDVKAVEYFLKERFDQLGLGAYKEYIHFGLTSQDINNTATPLLLRHALEQVYYPQMEKLLAQLSVMAKQWIGVPMLARTHGQPASPTTMGKEWQVFTARLREQLQQLKSIPHKAKFGGATGNLNAHYIAYPDIDWHVFANHFVAGDLGLNRSYPTTQIEHYDNLAAIFHALMRINTILIDFCRDVWTYISMEYFKQKTVANEVGSSAMPHKVNPIDFENAEGNLGLANALFDHMASKLPISRLQRDLTDSTVLRNVGVPMGHTHIALNSLMKGLGKIFLNESRLHADLDHNWMVIAEAIQNILRREGVDQPYEKLKALTRGQTDIGQTQIHEFIDTLQVADAVKAELKAITPFNYIGKP
ncbi:MAG: adenylosuccinate lyase [Saprospirales bacterium]|nr:adenylosuccinate lyase [Saprospirales bacterium]